MLNSFESTDLGILNGERAPSEAMNRLDFLKTSEAKVSGLELDLGVLTDSKTPELGAGTGYAVRAAGYFQDFEFIPEEDRNKQFRTVFADLGKLNKEGVEGDPLAEFMDERVTDLWWQTAFVKKGTQSSCQQTEISPESQISAKFYIEKMENRCLQEFLGLEGEGVSIRDEETQG